MEQPEKNTEPFIQTIWRTMLTTTIIALILWLVRAFPAHGKNSFALFGTIWAFIFYIVFGGHWLELLFINHIKFGLQKTGSFCMSQGSVIGSSARPRCLR
jgi:hypothetical protein